MEASARPWQRLAFPVCVCVCVLGDGTEDGGQR